MHADNVDIKEKITSKCLEQKQLHDITTLAASIKSMIVRHNTVLKDAGIRKEMQQLENWLEDERKGPAPACIISSCGVSWLMSLRDKIKLSVDEYQRFEGEGGAPATKDQIERNEELLRTVRRIDRIISDNDLSKPH